MKKTSTVKKSKRGRPEIYSLQLIERVMKLVKPGVRSVKASLDVVAKQSHKQLSYVPFLVAAARHGISLRDRIAKMKK